MSANNDLISRAALLEIYKNWLPQLTKPEDAGDRNGVETCIAVLKDAPAVDAVPADFHERCLQLEIHKRFAAEKAAPKWISVADRLPPLDAQGNARDITEEVLAIGDYDQYYIGRFLIYKFDGRFDFVGNDGKCKVTHWMPLPEPPTEV